MKQNPRKSKSFAWVFLLALLHSYFSPLASLEVEALPESSGLTQDLIDRFSKREGFSEGSFIGQRKTKVRYIRYANELRVPPRGTLVVVPGRTEPAWKYLELALDLHDLGFSPIYVIDHRGQGLSDRRFTDDRGHVENFHFYARDLAFLIHRIILPKKERERIFLLGQSMGGAVAADYLRQKPGVIHQAILSAPMLKIRFPEGHSELGLFWQTSIACALPKVIVGDLCHSYLPNTGPFSFEKWSYKQNNVTSSEARYEFSLHLMREFPNMRVGGPTMAWLQTAIETSRKLRRLAGDIQIPVMVLVSPNDSFVDNSGTEEFCHRAKNCELREIRGGLHELFQERDQIRSLALNYVDSFFEKYSWFETLD